MKYWMDVTLDFMSEDSDDPRNPEIMIIGKLAWTSESKPKLTLIIKILF